MSDERDRRRRVMIRVVVAPLLIAAIVGLIYGGYKAESNRALRGLVALMSLLALREVYAMLRLKGLKPAAWIGFTGLLLAHVAASPGVRHLIHVDVTPEGVAAGTVIATLLWMVCRHGVFEPADAGATLLGFGWLWLTTYLVRWVPTEPGGMEYLLFLLAANKGSDMAAYAAGKLIGRTKMAPVVSPNKTWEGAVAGLLVGGGVGAYILIRPMREHFPNAMETLLLLGAAATTVAAQLGDLVKSSVKRWAGVKDSGRLLPEFGGALDMIDSFVLSAPVAWCFASWLR